MTTFLLFVILTSSYTSFTHARQCFQCHQIVNKKGLTLAGENWCSKDTPSLKSAINCTYGNKQSSFGSAEAPQFSFHLTSPNSNEDKNEGPPEQEYCVKLTYRGNGTYTSGNYKTILRGCVKSRWFAIPTKCEQKRLTNWEDGTVWGKLVVEGGHTFGFESQLSNAEACRCQKDKCNGAVSFRIVPFGGIFLGLLSALIITRL